MVERVTQLLVDGLVHPVLALLVSTDIEITVCLDEVDILIDHIPDLLDACTIETTVTEDLWQPSTIGHREEMQGIPEIRSGHLALVDIVAVALVNDDTVADLHNTAFDTL